MPELRKKELFREADKLFAASGRVSLRTLIPLLKRRASNREVGPALVEWNAARGYAPALKVNELSVPLQGALAKVAGDLWAAAQAEAAARLAQGRENLAVTLRAGRRCSFAWTRWRRRTRACAKAWRVPRDGWTGRRRGWSEPGRRSSGTA